MLGIINSIMKTSVESITNTLNQTEERTSVVEDEETLHSSINKNKQINKWMDGWVD